MFKNSTIIVFFALTLAYLSFLVPQLSLAGSTKKFQERKSHDLIVGELLGRVDPDDLDRLIEKNYYPVLSKNFAGQLNCVSVSPNEIIYRIEYPLNNSNGHPQQIVFKFFETEQSLAAAIITDKIDFAITESEKIAQEVHNATTAFFIYFRYKKQNFVKMLAYNNAHFILRDKNVRKALTYSINREYILNKILKTQAYYADGPISEKSKFHAPGLEEYKFSQRKAIQFLRSEHWKDTNGDGIIDKNGMPFRIAIAYEKGVLLEEQIARRIKIDWNKLGVDMIRNPMTKDEMKANLAARDYDVMLMNHQYQDNIESFRKNFMSTSKGNFLAYNNKTTDKFIRIYQKMDSFASRKLMFQAIQDRINKDNPAAFLFFLWLERYFVNRIKFENFVDEKKTLLPFTEWKFRK